MAIVDEPRTRLFTIADVAALPSQLPSGPVDYELRQGRLTMMSPTGSDHGLVQARIAFALIEQGDRRGYGTTRTETGVILGREPADTLYGPDVSFLAKRSCPPRVSPEGYLETTPTLVVEVRSKNDTLAKLNEKVGDYLAAGVEVVWIADPQRKTVSAYRRGTAAIELGVSDLLTADGVIPGFQLPLIELFAE